MTALQALNWSLRLDYTFIFRVPDIPLVQKISFILKKYRIYLKNIFFGDSGINHATIFGIDYFYNESYGLASLQRVYCASYRLKRLLPSHPSVVDVGSNIGQFTFFCRHYLQAKRIISIEPLKDCHEVLKTNSADPSACLNFIVTRDPGEKRFFCCRETSQLSSYIKDEHTLYSEGVSLPCRTLNQIIHKTGMETIDLLKVDTEGSEYDVLLSADEILDRVKVVLVEMSVFRNCSGTIFKTGAYLNEQGFTLEALESWHGDRPKDVDAIFKKE